MAKKQYQEDDDDPMCSDRDCRPHTADGQGALVGGGQLTHFTLQVTYRETISRR